MKKIDKFFGISEKGSTIKVEILAGIATFLAMAYILVVNPNQILLDGVADVRWASVFIATALGAVIGTLLMSLYAKMPLAQASGMGLNSLVGTIIGGSMGFAFSFGNAMLLVLISGFLFLLLSVIPVKRNKETGRLVMLRELIFDGMPKSVRTAITVGIGLFIAYIGMQNAKIIVADKYVISGLVDFTSAENWAVGGAARTAVVGLFSFIIIAILAHFKIKGSVVIGILAGTILALPLQVTSIDVLLGKADGITWKFWENFQTFFSFDPANGGVFGAAFTEGFNMPEGSLMTCVMLVITFAMIDMFDTMGTVVGCTTNAGLIDETGKPLNYNRIMVSDSIATFVGAGIGTSTVTTFVESGAGVAVGGKTGLTALITAILFLLSIFLLPIFAFIPGSACAGALLYVGVLMMGNVTNIDFKNIKSAVPAFLTIIVMLLAYSITKGIGIGVISHVLISSISYVIEIIIYAIKNKKRKNNDASENTEEELVKPKWDCSVVAIVVCALFLVYFLVPTVI